MPTKQTNSTYTAAATSGTDTGFWLYPSWRTVWDRAIAPELSNSALLALRDALLADSAQLVQQQTTDPPYLHAVDSRGETVFDPRSDAVEAADAVAYGLWQADGLTTVHEVTLAFALFCERASRRLRDQSASLKDFFDFWDNSPREEVIPAVLAAVQAECLVRESQKRKPSRMSFFVAERVPTVAPGSLHAGYAAMAMMS